MVAGEFTSDSMSCFINKDASLSVSNPDMFLSRQALKKYILANHKTLNGDKQFDSQFNKALRTGVEKGDFDQPKGKQDIVRYIDYRCICMVVEWRRIGSRVAC